MLEKSIAEIVATSPEKRQHLYALFNTPEKREFLKTHWPFIGRPSQLPPPATRRLVELAYPRRPRLRQDTHRRRMDPHQYVRYLSIGSRALAPHRVDR